MSKYTAYINQYDEDGELEDYFKGNFSLLRCY